MKRKIIFRLRKLREDKSEVIFNMKNEQELARQRGGRSIPTRGNSIWLELGKNFEDLKNKNRLGKQKIGNAGGWRNKHKPISARFKMYILT